MIHVVRVKTPCEFCGKITQMEVICFWHDDEEGKDDYLKALLEGLSKTEELKGEFVELKSELAKKFEKLAEKWIGWKMHLDPRTKIRCLASNKIPENEDVLQMVVKKIIEETGPIVKPEEGKVVKKKRRGGDPGGVKHYRNIRER